MHPYAWTIIAEQRAAELRDEAARHRRLNAALQARPRGPAAALSTLRPRHGWVRAHLHRA